MSNVVKIVDYLSASNRDQKNTKQNPEDGDTILIRRHRNGDIDYFFDGAFQASRLLTAQAMVKVLGEVLEV
ncbi:hypothetical protein RA280_19630 [Cupriavidus sp. CV2]|uniref:hypothetical protein n=1 Tax=Cupriavidus ulmosensis TaxID=3065913 RepID=UPI00296A97E0|nr:hypothetical protein [Cupriavidus sp. CV2]MDW3683914.1 hypothetical protein [Cupriavidus sp. CV2]